MSLEKFNFLPFPSTEPCKTNQGRYHAVQLGMEVLQNSQSPETKHALLSLLEKLEAEKKNLLDKLKQPENQAPYVINFTNKIFDKANKEDREGNANKYATNFFFSFFIFFLFIYCLSELQH